MPRNLNGQDLIEVWRAGDEMRQEEFVPLAKHSEAIRKLIRSIAARSCSILAVMKHRATARSESIQHKMYMTDLDHSSTGFYTVLIVLTVSSTPTMPGVRPLNHPTFLQGRKTCRA